MEMMMKWQQIQMNNQENLNFERNNYYYGEILSDVTEKCHYDPDPNALPVGNGSYQVRMKLKREIPNFIPAAGKKIRISYTGCTFLCSNCFRVHSRRSCKNEKVMWIHYVKRFMTNNEKLEEDWFGKWHDIINTQHSNVRSNSSNHKQSNNKQNESFISKQLKAIREKSSQDKRKLEKERERERESEREREREREREQQQASKNLKPNPVIEIEKSKRSKNLPTPPNIPTEKLSPENECIMKEYDVEFYMKRGLNKIEAIEYIKYKLSVKKLWSKMTTNQ